MANGANTFNNYHFTFTLMQERLGIESGINLDKYSSDPNEKSCIIVL